MSPGSQSAAWAFSYVVRICPAPTIGLIGLQELPWGAVFAFGFFPPPFFPWLAVHQ
jgi:hypothetical protein